MKYTLYTYKIIYYDCNDFLETLLIPGNLYYVKIINVNAIKDDWDNSPPGTSVASVDEDNTLCIKNTLINDFKPSSLILFKGVYYSTILSNFESVFIDTKTNKYFLFTDIFSRVSPSYSQSLSGFHFEMNKKGIHRSSSTFKQEEERRTAQLIKNTIEGKKGHTVSFTSTRIHLTGIDK